MKWQDKFPSPPAGTTAAPSRAEDEAPAVIMLVTGEDAGGNAQWAYAKIPAQDYMAFKSAEAQGNYDLLQFGEILQSGSGSKPPAHIAKAMKEQHGCEDDFEDSLSQMILDAAQAVKDILAEQENTES